ncbi:hypothetical protein [Desulfobotulus mexicanus]|uniref:Uncharacterized protein n=1 Tax=Desulfobotulus mexicanus TaxID=2586642 RepID=A0A5S5MDB2_9BACT|nr:hypothetical protein [Desulfobotulus mexicanus]TYT73615.1 hypothetical protein FIM25_14155 [Desulfobotulus mexicanus]
MKDTTERSIAPSRDDGLTDDLDLSDLAMTLQAEGDGKGSVSVPVLEVASEDNSGEPFRVVPHPSESSVEDEDFIDLEDILVGSSPKSGGNKIPDLPVKKDIDPQPEEDLLLDPDDWVEEQDLDAADVPDFSQVSVAAPEGEVHVPSETELMFREEAIDLGDVGAFLEGDDFSLELDGKPVSDADSWNASDADDVLDLAVAGDLLEEDHISDSGENGFADEDVLDLEAAGILLEEDVPVEESDEGVFFEEDVLDLEAAGILLEEDVPVEESDEGVFSEEDVLDLEAAGILLEEDVPVEESDEGVFSEEDVLDLEAAGILLEEDVPVEESDEGEFSEEQAFSGEDEALFDLEEKAAISSDGKYFFVSDTIDEGGADSAFSFADEPEKDLDSDFDKGSNQDLAAESLMPDTGFVPLENNDFSEDMEQGSSVQALEDRLADVDFEAILERVVRKVFAEKLDMALVSVVERAVEKEIHALKDALYKDPS